MYGTILFTFETRAQNRSAHRTAAFQTARISYHRRIITGPLLSYRTNARPQSRKLTLLGGTTAQQRNTTNLLPFTGVYKSIYFQTKDDRHPKRRDTCIWLSAYYILLTMTKEEVNT